MVAKITTPKSISAALNYNEKKVQKGNAVCLYAANYLNEAKNMNFHQKLNGFERLNSLNDRATTKTLHVSLNFDPSEKLPDNKLIDIATVYMTKIGFTQQPFLVYKHEDAGHPHIHIVTTTIQTDGSRINTHNIGRNQSENARREIEILYCLVRPERHQRLPQPNIRPLDIEKVLYGKQETKRSISNIVTVVFNQYKFGSLPEFNAAIKQFNVVADRGKEEGRIYKNRGLVYRVLDVDGNKVGVPIKASSIGCKPTLQNLEHKFSFNQKFKEPFKEGIKNTLKECLLKAPGSMRQLITALEQKQIYTVLRQNADGRLYGITFVDNQNKCVFNGSDLGRPYSAAALQSRLVNTSGKSIKEHHLDSKRSAALEPEKVSNQKQPDKTILAEINNEGFLNVLLSAKAQHENTPSGLIKRKKKKKKKNHDL